MLPAHTFCELMPAIYVGARLEGALPSHVVIGSSIYILVAMMLQISTNLSASSFFFLQATLLAINSYPEASFATAQPGVIFRVHHVQHHSIAIQPNHGQPHLVVSQRARLFWSRQCAKPKHEYNLLHCPATWYA